MRLAMVSTVARAGAVHDWEDLLPLIHFENRQCGLRAQKILLAESNSRRHATR